MGSSKKIFSATLWTIIVNIINAFYGFISVPLLISYFGKENYGLIGLAMSINVYLNLMDLGFNSTNIRFFSEWITQNDNLKVRKLFQNNLFFYGCIGFLNCFILLVIACFSDKIFNLSAEQSITLKHLLYILAISAFVNWYSSCFDQLIRASENISWIQKRCLLPKLLQLAILFLTINLKFSIELYYTLTVFSTLIIIPVTLTKIKTLFKPISFIPKFDKKIFKEILPYSLNMLSFGIFQFSITYLRPVFLGIQGDINSVADYRILNAIVSLITLLGGAFLGIFLPSATKIITKKNYEAQNKLIYNGTKYITLILCLFCFGFISISNEAIILYVGRDYLYLVTWLNLWLLFTLTSHNQAISSLILAHNNINEITRMTIVTAILGLIITWILIPYYQVGGTVISILIYGGMQMIFYYFYYWPHKMKICSYRIFKESFTPFVLLGGSLSIILNSLHLCTFPALLSLLIKGSFFTFAYACICYKFLLKEQDIQFLKTIIKK